MTFTKADFDYSMMNIPIPSRKQYLRSLIIKIEDFIQRLRWKTTFFLKKQKDDLRKDTFGFKTVRNAPQYDELLSFEQDLTYLAANLEFKETKTKFQKRLANDIRKIQTSKNVFVKADKSSNYYEIDKNTYKKLLRDSVTANYKIADPDIEREINNSAREITDQLDISDRVEKIALKDSYITVKDHKNEFPNKIACRLINPTKPNIGKISKQFLDKINKELKNELKLKLLKNTEETIEWFQNLENKKQLQFIQFDIESYYPTISKELLDTALEFASQHTTITDLQKETITNARKSVLISNDKIWTKKDGPWDVTMGAFDGAQVTDLVGLYILHRLKTEIPEVQFTLYRDDGLGTHTRFSDTKIKNIKNRLKAVFDSLGLEIIVDTKLTSVNFLDVSMDLMDDSFKPFRKPNDTPIYVHKLSNHPPSVSKNLPKAINKRINQLSSSEQIFNNSRHDYEVALRKSGHYQKLTYQPTTNSNNKKKRNHRSRDEIWFTPPFNASLKTNIGKEFLKLIDKNFPKNKELHKICNRRTIKIGYSCTNNMGTIISNHNRKIMRKQDQIKVEKSCNCRKNNTCPLSKKCLSKNIVYKATEESSNINYVGMTCTDFKTRLANHTYSFKTHAKRNATTLAQYVWDKKLNPRPTIKWKILKQCTPYSPGQKSCDVCITEKLEILIHSKDPKNINKKTDLGTRCIHKKKFQLGTVT